MRFVPGGGFRGFVIFAVGLFLVASSLLSAQDATSQRPSITGISHVGYFVSDLPKARSFWHDLLGYDEMYDLKKPGTDQVQIAFIRF